MSAATSQQQAQADPFWDWIESPFIRVASVRRHGQWYAIAEDYRIATSGATEGEAYRDLARIVEAYLRSCHAAGTDYWSSMRQLPRYRKLWNVVRALLARALKGRAPEPIAEEARFMLPQFLDGAPNLT